MRREDWKTFDPLRILAPMVNEAGKLIEDDIADAGKINRILKLSIFFSGGLLSRADEVGPGKIIEKLEWLRKDNDNSWYEPAKPLREMDRAGKKFADLI